jgi:hypothetical protein
MIGELIRLLIAAACALFVLSLPLSKSETGAMLRRWAGVCIVLAFLPSIIGGLFYPAGTAPATSTTASPHAGLAPASDVFSTLGCITAVIVAALVAYGILRLRSRLTSKSKPRDPWESFFNRGGGKRPFTMNPKATRTRAPFGFDDDEEDD